MVKRVVFMLALMVMSNVFVASAQVSFESVTPEEAYATAGKEGKLVFMDLYAAWCPPCKAMERDVFSRSDVGDFMSKSFVSVKYNVDDSIGGELSRKYNVRSIPTYLVFTAEGEMVGRMMGAMSATDFMASMQGYIDSKR